MRKSGVRRLLLLMGAVLCIWLSGAILPGVVRLRDAKNLTSTPSTEGVPPEIVFATTALGGFRGILIDILWIRCQQMKQDGKFHEMRQLYKIITKMEPHYSKVWAFAAWDLAYNVSVEFDNLDDRWFWVDAGRRMLRDEGIPYNRRDPELYYELAWIYHHKIGGNTDYAHPLYRRELANEAEAALGVPMPGESCGGLELLDRLRKAPRETDVLLKSPAISEFFSALREAGFRPVAEMEKIAAGAIKNEAAKAIVNQERYAGALRELRDFLSARRVREILRLDPEIMHRLTLEFGPLDWRVPDSYSLYYATEARRINRFVNKEKPYDMKYERLVYFSLQEIVRRGRFHRTADGEVFNTPDLRFRETKRKYMQKTIKFYADLKKRGIYSASLVGMRSEYMYYLQRCVFDYYFNEQIHLAERYMGYLRELEPNNKKYQQTALKYVNNKQVLDEYFDYMSKDRLNWAIFSKLISGYLHLANGESGEFDRAMGWARRIWRHARNRYPKTPEKPGENADHKYFVPDYRDFELNALSIIFSGSEPRFRRLPKLMQNLRRMLPTVPGGAELLKEVEERMERIRADYLRRRSAAGAAGNQPRNSGKNPAMAP